MSKLYGEPSRDAGVVSLPTGRITEPGSIYPRQFVVKTSTNGKKLPEDEPLWVVGEEPRSNFEGCDRCQTVYVVDESEVERWVLKYPPSESWRKLWDKHNHVVVVCKCYGEFCE